MKRHRRYLSKSRVLAWCRAQLPENSDMKTYYLTITVTDACNLNDAIEVGRQSMIYLLQEVKEASDLNVNGSLEVVLDRDTTRFAQASLVRVG